MKKKLIIYAVIVLAIAAYFFRQQLSDPAPFFEESELIEEMNKSDGVLAVVEILDVLPVGERHMFVPYVLENGQYGFSTWTWNPSRKWEMNSYSSLGNPVLWNIDNRSERYFVYNIPPDDNVTGLTFYLIRDRNAWISYDVPAYLPRIQLEEKILLGDKRYGIFKFPKEWVELNERLMKNEAGRTDHLLFNMFPRHDLMYYSWRTVDQNGKLTFIEQNGANGYGSSWGGNILFLSPLNEGDLESGE